MPPGLPVRSRHRDIAPDARAACVALVLGEPVANVLGAEEPGADVLGAEGPGADGPEAMGAGARRPRVKALGNAWADPAALESEPRGRHRTTMVSPFDSLIWERSRTSFIPVASSVPAI